MHGDTAPIFEFSEHILDFMTLFVERFIVFDPCLRFFFGSMQGEISFSSDAALNPVGIVAAITQ